MEPTENNPRVIEVDHPLAAHHLATLRDRATGSAEFRAALHRITYLLAFEATVGLEMRPRMIDTPLEATTGEVLADRVGVMPILRAGLGMVDPVLTLLPDAEVWHLGFYRDESTLEPVEYYQKLPARHPVDVALVLDPMLATGGSALAALEAVSQWGASTVTLLSVLAAPEGIEKITDTFPEVSIFVAAIDRELDARGFILPGLGDAGDRTFNAKAD